MNPKTTTYSNLIFKTLILCSCLIMSVPSECFGINLGSPEQDESTDPELITCTIDKYGIKFLCDPHWTVQDINGNIFVTISKNPSIILTFAKIDSKIAFTSQISFQFLKQKNLYSDGFKMEAINFAGKNAIKVKAFSRTEPNMRRSDYFLINDSALYGVLFSAYPKESWEDFKFVIKKIEDSVVFTKIDHPENRKE